MAAGARVVVLGSAGTHVGPGRMCSSYLVEAAGYRLVLDCGNGSLSNLQLRCDVADVDAVLLSHLHPDHVADVYSLYYALRFHPGGPASVPVYAPAGAREHLARLLPAESVPTFAEHCRFEVAKAGDELELGPWRVTLHAAFHPVETLAPRLSYDGTVLAYSGDSAPTSALVECAAEADLFVCDSSWLERDGPHPGGVHMTGAQAGRTAEQAGAARLAVTHVLPTIDPAEVAAEARSAFAGEVLAAHDLREIRL